MGYRTIPYCMHGIVTPQNVARPRLHLNYLEVTSFCMMVWLGWRYNRVEVSFQLKNAGSKAANSTLGK